MLSDLVIGVDIGATNLRVALGSLDLGIVRKVMERTPKTENPEKVIEQIVKLIEMVASDQLAKIKAIGIGSIGPLDLRKGMILHTPNAPFKNVPIVKGLTEKFKVPVYLLNDCNAAVLGEKIFGRGKNVDNLFYVTMSSGIGGGAIVDGNLLFGKDGNAVELGHMIVDFEGRLKCGCGARGHWEAYCSGVNIPNFVKYLIEEYPERFRGSELEGLVEAGNLTSEKLFERAKQGDRHALMVIDELGKINTVGFANINTLYDPELITVGGPIALFNRELVINPIVKNLKDYTVNRVPEIVITPLGEDIVLYGAIALAANPPSRLLSLNPLENP